MACHVHRSMAGLGRLEGGGAHRIVIMRLDAQIIYIDAHFEYTGHSLNYSIDFLH